MSLLPGTWPDILAGWPAVPPGTCSGLLAFAARQALTAGQTPASLVSFHTATP